MFFSCLLAVYMVIFVLFAMKIALQYLLIISELMCAILSKNCIFRLHVFIRQNSLAFIISVCLVSVHNVSKESVVAFYEYIVVESDFLFSNVGFCC